MKKKTILSVLSSLCAILFLANCGGGGDSGSDGPTLNVSPSNVTLDANGSAQTISVSSNTSWTVQREDSWINCSPMDGTGGNSITITASENTGEDRYTRLKITDKTGRATAEVRITQKGAGTTPSPTPTPTLEVNKNSMSFSASGGNDSFTITSNTSWTVSSNQTWCTVSPASGSNDGTVNVTVYANDSNSERSAKITVKSGNVTREVSITQAAKPEENVNIGRDDYDNDINLDNK